MLKEVHAEALATLDQAAELQHSGYGSMASWQGHASLLTDLKGNVNALGSSVARLEALRDAASPEERLEIDRVNPLVRDLANATSGAIVYINGHLPDVWQPQYRQYLDTLVDKSEQLGKSTGEFLQFSYTRGKEKHLERDLGIQTGE